MKSGVSMTVFGDEHHKFKELGYMSGLGCEVEVH